jgi:DNA-binding MarR family transcriptional regulator
MKPIIDFGLLLAKAFQELIDELHATMGEGGFDDIGRNDGFVFRALAGQPTTVSALSARLEISKQGTGQIIDDMERRGYVRRRPDPSDARARLVELSDRGTAALECARTFHRSYESRLVAKVGRGDVTTVRHVLAVMSGGGEEFDARLRANLL